jgi:predicted flavoprotein YhiN
MGEFKTVAIIGGGPAGLMAAEQLLAGGVRGHLFDAMPTVGRKFLMAGKSGLNIANDEPAARFAEHYDAPDWLAPMPHMLLGRGMMGDGVIDLPAIFGALEAGG